MSALDKLTVGEVRELVKMFGAGSGSTAVPFKVGEKWFFRTVTHYLTGRVTEIDGDFVTLKDAAWIADTGRFMTFVEKGELLECEPVTGPVVVNIKALVDAYPWRHDLPRTQK